MPAGARYAEPSLDGLKHQVPDVRAAEAGVNHSAPGDDLAVMGVDEEGEGQKRAGRKMAVKQRRVAADRSVDLRVRLSRTTVIRFAVSRD